MPISRIVEASGATEIGFDDESTYVSTFGYLRDGLQRVLFVYPSDVPLEVQTAMLGPGGDQGAEPTSVVAAWFGLCDGDWHVWVVSLFDENFGIPDDFETMDDLALIADADLACPEVDW